MTQTYDVADNFNNDVHKVRLYIGDTDVTDDNANLEDEEISFVLGKEPNFWYAAAESALIIARKLNAGIYEDEKVGETRLRTKKVAELKLLADQLRARGATHKLPSAGGIFKDEREAYEKDTNILQGSFKRRMHDYKVGDRRDDLLGNT